MPEQILKEIQARMQKATVGTIEFSQAYKQLNSLVNAGNIEAGLYLSWVYIQRGEIKGAIKKAYDLCQQIAEKTGHPAALERMADLLLWGVGIEKDEEKSFQIYQQLANQGRLPLTTLAYLHSKGIGTDADECEASSLILKSAAQGDTLAFVLLSYRYEMGLGVPINGKIARAYAILANKREFPGSSQRLKKLNIRFASVLDIEVEELAAKLIHNIEGLYDKVHLLSQTIAQNNPEFVGKYIQLLSDNLAELNIKDLSTSSEIRGCHVSRRIAPIYKSNIIRDKPLIMVIENFADFEECQYIIDQAIPMLESTEKQVQRKSKTEIDAFSGDSTIFARKQIFPIDRTIQKRCSEIEGIPITHFEPMSLLRYSVGHDYSVHTDAFDEERIAEHEKKGDFGGQRMTVNLIYLLPAIKGGETHYENIDLKISGQIGTGIIHHNATDDFKPDLKSLHTGTEILEGEKWLLRTATRQYPLYGLDKVTI